MTEIEEMFKEGRSSKAEEIIGIVKAIFDANNLNLKGNLKRHQIARMIILATYAQHFKSRVATKVLTYCLELSVSDTARGRDDMVKALQATLLQETKGSQNVVQKLLGIGG